MTMDRARMELSYDEVLAIETAELAAWRDMYTAMPDSFRQEYKPELVDIGNTVLTRCQRIPFVHFNAVLNLGLHAATETTVKNAIAEYRAASIRKFVVLHHQYCRPAALPEWLRAHGCEAKRGWDRVY